MESFPRLCGDRFQAPSAGRAFEVRRVHVPTGKTIWCGRWFADDGTRGLQATLTLTSAFFVRYGGGGGGAAQEVDKYFFRIHSGKKTLQLTAVPSSPLGPFKERERNKKRKRTDYTGT